MPWVQESPSRGALIAIVVTVALFFNSNISKIIAAWPFFTRRYDFIKSNFAKTKRNTFSFNVLSVRIPSPNRIGYDILIALCKLALRHGSQGRGRAQSIF